MHLQFALKFALKFLNLDLQSFWLLFLQAKTLLQTPDPFLVIFSLQHLLLTRSPVHLVFVLLVGHGSHVMRSDGSSLNCRGRRRGRRRRKRLDQNWKSLQIHRLGHQGVEVHRGQLVKVHRGQLIKIKVKVGSQEVVLNGLLGLTGGKMTTCPGNWTSG